MRTILVVDDEPAILKVLTATLRREFNVLTAEDGEQGLALLATLQVDLILSDQMMPGMTGVEFLRQAGLQQPRAARILMTGFAELQTVIDAINIAGVSKYIQKPWDVQHLLNVVRGCFAASADEAAQGTPPE